MDFFEKRIKEQRSALDHVESVDEAKLWQGIQAGLNSEPAKPKMSFLKWYAIAASLLLLICFGWLMYHQGQMSLQEVRYVKEIQEPIELPTKLKKEEESFKTAVANKKKTLQLENIKKGEFQDIFAELELLEEVHQEFRKDLPVISDEEKIIKILKKYYERKLRILDRLTKEIEKKSRYEKRNKEKSL